MEVEQIDDSTIFLNGKTLKFEWKIREVVPLSDRVLVRFSILSFPEQDPNAGRNIFAFDSDGNDLWRIEDAHVKVKGRTVSEVSQGYTDIERTEDESLFAWVLEWRHDLDPETGKISNPKYFR